MTLQEIIKAVRDELLEPTPGFWSDEEITRWINEANNELTEKAKVEAAPYTFTTTANTSNYSLPSDLYQIKLIKINDNKIYPASIDVLNSSVIGFPIYYVVFNNQLYFYPIPDDTYTVRLYYYKKANQLVNTTDVPVLPERYHYLLKLYAISQAKRKADDPAYIVYYNDYLSGKNDMIQNSKIYQIDRFKVVLDDDWR